MSATAFKSYQQRWLHLLFPPVLVLVPHEPMVIQPLAPLQLVQQRRVSPGCVFTPIALCHRAAGSPDELRVALSAAPYIAHFGLHAEFSEAQVLGVLLGAGEVEAAIELSRGETKVCVSYQRSVLRHVVERSPGVGGTETGGQAALLAVTFNPQKRATCPIPVSESLGVG